ncbi:MAG: TonB-dependent receptor family protein [Chitinophaga sp.]|uniref:outer membrane beta-barrel family protein n=1 Tax=Chitinophaga sp. TaxID=1869181 RepID=UPI0025C3119E|nr:outer membrane beta-barrel family protein [Chitinophaga sp.]MBV8254764.1 TonB-dependent receptor family protein [Chitinophaga sp.]
MNKIVAILFFIFICSTIHAQNKIVGKVQDTKQYPIINAFILVYQTSAQPPMLQLQTDTAGKFQLEAPLLNTWYIKIAAYGYKDTTIVFNEQLSKSTKPLLVTLADGAKTLQGITVNGNKPLITQKIDRLVFNVENSISAAGSDAWETLKKTPGVTVGNGSIALIGKSSVQVMINDKLVQLSGEDLMNYLRSFSADEIAQIEIITTPPAKYDAAGNSGIINIKMKKRHQQGVQGSVRTAYEQQSYARFSGGGNINYGYDRWNIYGNVNYAKGSRSADENISSDYPGLARKESSTRRDYSNSLLYTAGMDYELSKRAVIGIQYTGGQTKPDIRENNMVLFYRGNDHIGLDSTSATSAYSHRLAHLNTINLNYEWKIDSSGRKLNADVNYFGIGTSKERNAITNNFFDNQQPTGFYEQPRTNADLKIDIFSSRLDLDWPTKWANLTFGGKVTTAKNESENIQAYKIADAYVEDKDKSNQFVYKEQVQALYASGEKEFGKISLQAGLRGEFTQTNATSIKLAQQNKNNYFNLFPTAYAQYSFNEANQVNINYSRRIDRPGYTQLDPFRWYTTPKSYSEGNPFLQPSYSSNVELNYMLHSKYTFGAYYQHVSNISAQAAYFDTVSQVRYFKIDNIGESRNVGVMVSASLKLTKWWESTNQIHGYYSTFITSYYGGESIQYDNLSFYAETNNSFILNKHRTLLAEVRYTYQYRQQVDFSVSQPTQNLSAGIKLQLLKNRLLLALNGNDILATNKVRSVNKFLPISINNYYDDRNVRLSVTYRWKSKTAKEQRQRSTGIEEEKKRTNQ